MQEQKEVQLSTMKPFRRNSSAENVGYGRLVRIESCCAFSYASFLFVKPTERFGLERARGSAWQVAFNLKRPFLLICWKAY